MAGGIVSSRSFRSPRLRVSLPVGARVLLAIGFLGLLALGCHGRAGDDDIASKTLSGPVDTGSPGSATIEIAVSEDGESIESISLTYSTDVGWGFDASSEGDSGPLEFVNYEEHVFDPGVVPITEGGILYSRPSFDDSRCLAVLAGEFISSTEVSGTLRVYRVVGAHFDVPAGRIEGGRLEITEELSWTANAE